jgi:hypothetical protein
MRWLKLVTVIIGALIVTALGIDAADTITGSRFTLIASIIGSSHEVTACPTGMIELKNEAQSICVDTYEAGVGSDCSVAEPHSVQDTLQNLQKNECKPVSAPHIYPWRFVTYRLAEQLCARAGKTLLVPGIWYKAALGTPDTFSACAVSEQFVSRTGEHANCISGSGAYDMIGNVWELVHGEVINGILNDFSLPETGYITAVNDDGIPSATKIDQDPLYGEDYFWREASGTFAIMRGGFYKGQHDAGLYSTQAGITQDFSGEAIGFRCMKTL